MKETHLLPRVSVIMSVYNGERYLAQAVESILDQTFADFEFIIINDGSTDGTAEILRSYDDRRLRLFEQSNVGLTRSLNRGISLARGEYIARMDSDDVSLPTRLERQVEFMDRHPDVVLLGTAWRHIDLVRGFERDIVYPTGDADLRRAMVVENPFGHPSVMIRANALRAMNGYDESFRYVQDYELWSRLALVGQIANLPEVLVLRRYHLDNVTNSLRAQFTRLVLNMKAQYLAIQRLGFPKRYLLYALRPLLLFPLEMAYMSRARHSRGRGGHAACLN